MPIRTYFMYIIEKIHIMGYTYINYISDLGPLVEEVLGIHPSKDIICATSRLLAGKRIALALCGSVAAVRSPDLARGLMRHGAEVFAVMSAASQSLITPDLMEWATGNPVVTSLTGKIEHVALGGGCDGSANLVIIAPATANTVSKIALGIDDTPVTSLATTAIGAGIPMIVAPAMHASMMRHPAVVENMKRLEAMGITVLAPEQAEGKAKIASNERIVEAALAALAKKDLKGKRILITAGSTRSYMDAIRYLTNSSSGKMGFALALEASARGAEVRLVAGPVSVPELPGIPVTRVSTTEEMLDAVLSELKSGHYDALILAAAPLDFAFSRRKNGKISSDSVLSLKLSPLPKISRAARNASPMLFIIGFKAEYDLPEEELIQRALARLTDSGMDLIAANDLSKAGRGFESETNEVYLIDRSGLFHRVPLSHKREVARQILDAYSSRESRQ